MKFFLSKLFLYLIPLGIFILPPGYFLFKNQEIFNDCNSNIEDLYRRRDYLLGFRFNETSYRHIKYNIFLKLNPEIIALGSSRMLPFREEMFDVKFYNCGYTVSRISEFMQFVKNIPDSSNCKNLIIGIDHWMLNQEWDDLKITNSQESMYTECNAKKNITFREGVDIWKNYLLFGNLDKDQSSKIKKIGVNATWHNTGFRNDGSMYYGSQIKKLANKDSSAVDFEFKETLARIEKGRNRFEFGEHVNPKAISKLNEFLKYCKKRNIKVIAILPPYSDKVYSAMNSSKKYGYIKKAYPSLKPIFEKFDFEIFDYSSINELGASDEEFIDGFHGSEKAYLRILTDIANKSSLLKSLVNNENNSYYLKSLQSNFDIY